MNRTQYLTVLFILTSVVQLQLLVEAHNVAPATRQGPRHQVDVTGYCGLQHTDDYVREINATAIDEFPWVAGLIYKFVPDGALAILCSGSLINRNYVLTAAQCLTHPRDTVLVAVRLGEYHVQNETDCAITSRYEPDCSKAVDFGIEEIIVHSGYNRQTRVNDIALLRLDKIILEFTEYIRPICLYPVKSTYANTGEVLYSSGYGRKANVEEQTQFKKKISTGLITNFQCTKEFPGRVINDNHLCTRDLPKSVDFSCDGDAGAPVMFSTGPPPKWHLEGVYSWGGKCGFAQPQIYTRVSKYLPWIEEHVRD